MTGGPEAPDSSERERAAVPGEPDGPPAATAGVDVVGRHRGLARRTALVSTLTLLSRVLGYARESVMAALFGDASTINDAFNTAWRVPNLFRRLLGEGALATSLQTTLTEVDGSAGEEAGRRLFLASLRLTAGLLVGLCAVLMGFFVLAPEALPLTGWHWLGSDPDSVRELTLRLLPFVVLVCISAQIGGALQVRGEFRISSAAPAVLNVVWIAVLGALLWERGGFAGAEGREDQLAMARVIAWAVLGAGVVQVAVQVPTLMRLGLLRASPALLAAGTRAAFDAAGAARRVLATAAPLAFGAAVYQVNVLVDGYMAQGLLRTGGPTAYHYASRLQQFPVALVATSAIAAVFPALKALGHTRRLGELRALHDRAQLGVLFLALPAAVGLALFARPICALLFQHGRFGPDGVERAAATLAMLAMAVPSTGMVGLLSRAYYSVGDLMTPVRVSFVVLGTNLVLNLALVLGLGMDADGFGLATALSSWLNVALLWPRLTRAGIPAGGTPIVSRLARLLLCAGPAVAVGRLTQWASLAGAAPNGARAALALALGIAVAGALHFSLARLLGLPEAREAAARLLRRRPPPA